MFCSSKTSIKTRIETKKRVIILITKRQTVAVRLPLKQGLKPSITSFFTDIFGVVVAVRLPLKQGLKHKNYEAWQTPKKVAVRLPLKQGLKLRVSAVNQTKQGGSSKTSIKTRIETQKYNNIHNKSILVAVRLPLKQGLKLP